MLAFQMDGVFIGATWSRDMRNMMLLSLAVYLAVWWVLAPLLGIAGLWIALLVFLGVRGVTLYWRCRAPSGERFPAVLIATCLSLEPRAHPDSRPAIDIAPTMSAIDATAVPIEARRPVTMRARQGPALHRRGRYRAARGRRRRAIFGEGRLGRIDAADADQHQAGPASCRTLASIDVERRTAAGPRGRRPRAACAILGDARRGRSSCWRRSARRCPTSPAIRTIASSASSSRSGAILTRSGTRRVGAASRAATTAREQRRRGHRPPAGRGGPACWARRC